MVKQQKKPIVRPPKRVRAVCPDPNALQAETHSSDSESPGYLHILNADLKDFKKHKMPASVQTGPRSVRRVRRGKAAKYHGVRQRNGRWVAEFREGSFRKWIGSHASPEQAAWAYDKFVRERHGPNAEVNFPLAESEVESEVNQASEVVSDLESDVKSEPTKCMTNFGLEEDNFESEEDRESQIEMEKEALEEDNFGSEQERGTQNNFEWEEDRETQTDLFWDILDHIPVYFEGPVPPLDDIKLGPEFDKVRLAPDKSDLNSDSDGVDWHSDICD